jgi:hypothetical protein
MTHLYRVAITGAANSLYVIHSCRSDSYVAMASPNIVWG